MEGHALIPVPLKGDGPNAKGLHHRIKYPHWDARGAPSWEVLVEARYRDWLEVRDCDCTMSRSPHCMCALAGRL